MLHLPVFFIAKSAAEYLKHKGHACGQMGCKLLQTGGQRLSLGSSFLPLGEHHPR